MLDQRLQDIIEAQRYPLVFVTVNGSHLYGFSSPHSDYDLRGMHVLPVREVLGLQEYQETNNRITTHAGLEIDLVTHDMRKFFKLLLSKNGNVLECIYSPLVVYTTPEHEELKALAMRCVTRAYAAYYLGFAASQLRVLGKEELPRVKSVLHLYRIILTGLYLIQTGQLEPNLVHLHEEFKLSYIAELIARKQSEAGHSVVEQAELAFHEAEVARLLVELEDSPKHSALPSEPDEQVQAALNNLLLRLRLKSV